MENTDLSDPDYMSIFIQWALFLVLVGAWLIPAFFFRKLAKAYHKTGWVYFLIGLGVGLASMLISGFAMRAVQTMAGRQQALPYLIALFILPFVLSYVVFRILKTSLSKGG